MERLPYIDEHGITVAAERAATWLALLRMWCRDTDDPSTVRSPFFWLDDATPGTRLALNGGHLFSRYRLVFELTDVGPQRTRVTAATWARFPGVHGFLYRTAVIGTGAHRIAVRRMLKQIATDAVRLRNAAA